jgi:hypothetical protein
VSPGPAAQIVPDLVQWVASVLEHLHEARIHLDYVDVHLPGRNILHPGLPRTLVLSAHLGAAVGKGHQLGMVCGWLECGAC